MRSPRPSRGENISWCRIPILREAAAELFQDIGREVFASHTERQAAGDCNHRNQSGDERLEKRCRDTKLLKGCNDTEDEHAPSGEGPDKRAVRKSPSAHRSRDPQIETT